MTTSGAPDLDEATAVFTEVGYAYADIARIVQLSQAAARQLVSRTRKHITRGTRTSVVASKRRALLDAFVAAARVGDLAGLERLFAQDVVSRTDSGGVLRPAARVGSGTRGRRHLGRRPRHLHEPVCSSRSGRADRDGVMPPGRTGYRTASCAPATR